jgi:hypothetical protein
MKVIRKQYKQAVQKGQTAQAKRLRREYFQEAYINLAIAASPIEILFPNPKLEAVMEKISQELED